MNAELLKLRIWRDDKFMRRPTANCTIVALSATCFIDFFFCGNGGLALEARTTAAAAAVTTMHGK